MFSLPENLRKVRMSKKSSMPRSIFSKGTPTSDLGGKCLIALAFLKAGKLDHPRVREAIEECAKIERANRQRSTYSTTTATASRSFSSAKSLRKKHSREHPILPVPPEDAANEAGRLGV